MPIVFTRCVSGLLLTALLCAVACGGSSSETPPPLEPDFDRLRAQQAKRPKPGAEADGVEFSPLEEPSEQPLDPRDLPDTWGGSRTPPPPPPASSSDIEAPF